MKITLRSWPEKVEIANSRDFFNATDYMPVNFHRVDDALRWLRPHMANSLSMKSLRQLLAAENISHTDAMSAQQVVHKTAELLYQKKLMLARTALMKIQPVIIEYSKKAAPVETTTAAPAAPKAPDPVIQPEPEEEDNTDHAAQAETLKTAAEEGAPFCEECEKAKQQNAA